MGKVTALVSHSCCHEFVGAAQGPAIRVSPVNEHWSKMQKCEVLLRQSIREKLLPWHGSLRVLLTQRVPVPSPAAPW